MFRSIIKWFTGPTPEEAYQDGRKTVDEYLRKGDPTAVDELWALSSGGFNTTESHRQFDRGVQDRLEELGYECPY